MRRASEPSVGLPPPAIGVLAADLQGAVTAAGRLRQRGLKPAVIRDRTNETHGYDALVVDLDMHHAVADPAKIVQRWTRWLLEQGTPRLEVMLHAELRGDPGALVRGLLDGAGNTEPLLLVVPAYPTSGRVCVDGHLLCPRPNGSSLDVKVDDALGLDDAEVVTLARVNLGAEAVLQSVRDGRDRGKRCWIIDATVETHLEVAAKAASALARSGDPVVTASTGGWLRFFPELGTDGFVVVVAAATHETDRLQLNRVADHYGDRALTTTATEASRWSRRQVADVLSLHRVLVLHEVNSKEIDPWAVAQTIAAVVRRMLDLSSTGKNPCLGLVASGGLTTSALVDALSGGSLVAGLELEPLCPVSTISSGPFKGITILTKASGNGSEDTVVRMIRQILGT